MFEGESNIVGDEQVEMAVAVVVDKAAARAPAWLIIPETHRLCHICEGTVAIVAIETVLSKIRAEKILKTIVVIVPDADSRRPPDRSQSGFFCNISKRAVAIVLVETVGSLRGIAA